MSTTSRLSALVMWVPVLASLGMFGVALGHPLLAALAALAGLLGVVRRVPLSGARLHLIAGGIGAGLGGLAFLLNPPAPGLFPPLVLSPLCGALAGLAAMDGMRHHSTGAWTWAGILAAISASNAAVLAALQGPLLLGGVSLGVALVVHSGASLRQPGRLLAMIGVLALGGGGTALGVRVLALSEGMLLPILDLLIDTSAFTAGPGLTEAILIQPVSMVSLSEHPILEVAGSPSPPTLRGQVMDVFDGITWTASPAMGRPTAVAPPLDGGRPPVSLELTFLSSVQAVLPTPAGTLRVEGAVPAWTAGWLVVDSPARGDVYGLEWSGVALLPPEPPPGPELVVIPAALAAQLRPLTAPWIVGQEDHRGKAAAIAAHFVEEYTYSLSTDLRGEPHPLVVLVREKRPAYCIYFASAMAAMLRAEGIPARLVGGFALPESNPLTGRTMVRRRDAHAWVEVWIPESGRWEAFDPTPSRESVVGSGRLAWGEAVLRALQDGLLRLLTRLRTQPGSVLREVVLSWPVAALVGVGVVWSVWLRVRGRSLRALRWGGGEVVQTDPRLLPYYRRYQRRMERYLGQRVSSTDSDEEVLSRLEGGGVAQAAVAFLERYRRARYRGEVAGAGPELEVLLSALAREMQRNPLRRGA